MLRPESTMSPSRSPDLMQAQFNPLIRAYLVAVPALVMLITVIGIPLAVVWLLGLGPLWAHRYYKNLRCELTDTELRFRKGILFHVEKTIPLENIQDVTFLEGPVLRQFNLSTLKFETAGSSGGPAGAGDMQLTGIVGAAEFRQEILRRRNVLRRGGGPSASGVESSEVLAVLRTISGQLDALLHALRERK